MQSNPFFSVIIPTHDRPMRLAECLEAISRSYYPHDRFEVIVVDDGGQTSPAAIVESFSNRLDVRLITQPHGGPGKARNTGAAQARGEFLTFTDDDCAPAPDWLQALAARFETMNDCVIGGRTLNGLPNNLYSTTSQILIDYLYSYYNANREQASFFTSNNFAIATAQFQAIGGFDGSFPRAAAEDREFCDRWRQDSRRMIYAAEVLVSHSHSMTLHSFWRQHFTYGRGAFHFHRVRARREIEHIKFEPLKFYWNLIRYPFSDAQRKRPWIVAGLLVLTQVANAAGFYWEKIVRLQKRFAMDRRPPVYS